MTGPSNSTSTGPARLECQGFDKCYRDYLSETDSKDAVKFKDEYIATVCSSCDRYPPVVKIATAVKQQQKILEKAFELAIKNHLVNLRLSKEERRELAFLAYMLSNACSNLARESATLAFKPIFYDTLHGTGIHVTGSYIESVERTLAEFKEFYSNLLSRAREELVSGEQQEEDSSD